jgi:glycosyltransferase involved in cell wall biosynthesis
VEENNLKNKNQPLVSILVITYNSSKYIVETLNSAQNQSYNNLELIITDDCSTDNTFNICEEWINQNSGCFKNVKLVRPEKNLGIAGNCNYGLKFCHGEWVKLIAGDDILLPDCLEEYNKFALNYKESSFIFSFPRILLLPANESQLLKKELAYKEKSFFFEMDSWQQHLYLINHDLPMSASTFYFNRYEMVKVGGFDENYMEEDRPLYMSLTRRGYQLMNIPKSLVEYRIHPENFSTRNKKNTPINEFWLDRVHNIVSKYLDISLLLKAPLVYFEYYNKYIISKLTIAIGNNYSNFRIIRKLRYLSPLFFKEHFKKNKFN